MVGHVPFCDELLLFTHNLKQLVTGLLAVTSVEKVLQWYRSLQCADYIQLLTFCVPYNGKKNMQINKIIQSAVCYSHLNHFQPIVFLLN